MKWKYEFDINQITERGHKRLMNDLLWAMGNVHKDITLPGHFVQGANRKYHYKKRTDRWLAQKLRLYGQKPDLVASGTLANAVFANSKITATADHWKLYTKKLPFALPDWMRAEIEKINQSEVRAYKRMLSTHYVRKVKSPPYARRRRVKGP